MNECQTKYESIYLWRVSKENQPFQRLDEFAAMMHLIYSSELRRGTAEVTPVEIKPLPCQKTGQAWSRKQERYAVYS
jgi:hypothetical protein